jgi:hypothetical protein
MPMLVIIKLMLIILKLMLVSASLVISGIGSITIFLLF